MLRGWPVDRDRREPREDERLPLTNRLYGLRGLQAEDGFLRLLKHRGAAQWLVNRLADGLDEFGVTAGVSPHFILEDEPRAPPGMWF